MTNVIITIITIIITIIIIIITIIIIIITIIIITITSELSQRILAMLDILTASSSLSFS